MRVRFSNHQKVLAAFALGLFIILSITFLTYRTISTDQQVLQQVNQSNLSLSNLDTLLSQLNSAEAGEADYIITGDPSYLQSYSTAVSAINSTEQLISASVAGDANLTADYAQLLPAIHDRLSEMAQAIDARQTGGLAAAQAVVSANAESTRSTEIASTVGKMESYISSLQAQQIALSNQSNAQRLEITFLDSLIALAVITISGYEVGKNLRIEEKARKEAQLLQDILTHDIRNYNQIQLMNAELLNEGLKGNRELGALASNLVRGVENSTRFVDRAQRLGWIMSDSRPQLQPVNLLETIDRALLQAQSAFPKKQVMRSIKLPDELPASDRVMVLADDLLEEVFSNIFTNAVKYTKGNVVPIEVSVESWPPSHVGGNGSGLGTTLLAYLKKAGNRPKWRVSIADRGVGIPESKKRLIFQRYASSRGTGLGMSIIQALVKRYDGDVSVKDRRDGKGSADNSTGTIVVVTLRKV